MSDTSVKSSGNRRLSSRLQKRAPASIKISPATDWNVAIPLLSPLDGSPPSLPLRASEIKDCRDNARKNNVTEKAPAPVVYKKWQHPAAPFCYNETAPMRPFMFCTAVSDRS
ncbi:hypothetical protein DCAR_0832251 [Daucus carota subsp. sativus]|uniref:Uncharacterized protein n=1 Tax=Daucus carota subsp. sativus TaxID=79200 RepID=A0A175YNJ7_DAUCS|nr:PREDICTED: uncharacterized protein At4g14450, chloroplastic-like [Daucus carota subsp. sativus]WOH12743.1 hypothetical protein DCAR_0832251 [Daucus carota subsp. sativus]